jgi:hypothetical protein
MNAADIGAFRNFVEEFRRWKRKIKPAGRTPEARQESGMGWDEAEREQKRHATMDRNKRAAAAVGPLQPIGAGLGSLVGGQMVSGQINQTEPAYPMPARFGELAGLLDLAHKKVGHVQDAIDRLESNLQSVLTKPDEAVKADEGLSAGSDAGVCAANLIGRLESVYARLEALRYRLAV